MLTPNTTALANGASDIHVTQSDASLSLFVRTDIVASIIYVNCRQGCQQKPHGKEGFYTQVYHIMIGMESECSEARTDAPKQLKILD